MGVTFLCVNTTDCVPGRVIVLSFIGCTDLYISGVCACNTTDCFPGGVIVLSFIGCTYLDITGVCACKTTDCVPGGVIVLSSFIVCTDLVIPGADT